MVSQLFTRLSTEKQERIEAALLTEFSEHPLAEAQVARIVKQADIARGAFYQYFDDLPDAYRYLFGQAMRSIHAKLPAEATTVDNTLDSARTFLAGSQSSPYYDLICMHFAHNELAVTPQASPQIDNPKTWAATVLSHTTIRDVLLEPESADARLAQLEAALAALKEG